MKTIALLISSIFLLALTAGLASAAVLAEWNLTTDGVATSVSHVNAGNFVGGAGISALTFGASGVYADSWSTSTIDTADYFEVTIAPASGYNIVISDINFGERRSLTGITNYQVQWSKNSDFSSPTTIATVTVPDNDTERDGSIPSLNISVNNGETLRIRFYGYNAEAAAGTWRINDVTLNIEGTVSPVATDTEPEEIIDCDLTGDSGGDLDINLDYKVTGYGDDNEWLPLDEIELEIEVKNRNSDDKIENIVVGWGLYDTENDEWYVDDEENDFDLKKKDSETLTVTFQLDEDIDTLNDGTYVLYVWANGELDSDTPEDICTSVSDEISIVIESDFVVLDDIQYTEPAQCGTDLQVTADVWNIGDDDQDDVFVLLNSKDLGIKNQKVLIGSIDAFDKEPLTTIVKIPSDIKAGTYDLSFAVYNEDDEIYENDFDEEQSLMVFSIKVEGNCGVSAEPQVTLSAVKESGGKAGEDLIIKTTITSTDDAAQLSIYELSVKEYTGWASAVSLEQNSVAIGAGESKDVLITFNVNKGISGEKLFEIELLSPDGKQVLTQPVMVTIEESGTNLSSLFGGNWYLWAIGVLNVILVVIIIVVAVRVARK